MGTGSLASVTSSRTVGEIFNLGKAKQITIKTLAARSIAAPGSKIPIRYIPHSEAYGEGFAEGDRMPALAKNTLASVTLRGAPWRRLSAR